MPQETLEQLVELACLDRLVHLAQMVLMERWESQDLKEMSAKEAQLDLPASLEYLEMLALKVIEVGLE